MEAWVRTGGGEFLFGGRYLPLVEVFSYRYYHSAVSTLLIYLLPFYHSRVGTTRILPLPFLLDSTYLISRCTVYLYYTQIPPYTSDVVDPPSQITALLS